MSSSACRRFVICFPALLTASLLAAAVPAAAADTIWTGTTPGSWGNTANWTGGVPNATTSASTGGAGADILLGANAQATTLFIDGPIGGESQLSSGTLTLSDQLWINLPRVVSGTTYDPTILRLYDGGSAPVSVTANKASIGVDAGKQGAVILDSQPGGSVTLSVVDTLTIGYDGSYNYVYTMPFSPIAAGAIAISAGTIETSVLATAGTDYYNYIGTYTSGAAVNATNLNSGVAGQQGGAENYGGNWTVVNTQVGVQSTASQNYITVGDGGTYTNSGVFTVGVAGSNNTVYLGFDGTSTYGQTVGTLNVTGTNDVVIGAVSTANANRLSVDLSVLSVSQNIIVGLDGHSNQLTVDNGSTLTSTGARLGVNAGSSDNYVSVSGSSAWTMNGTVRVGDKGSNNTFIIMNGGTVTLTGLDKNFFVGYEKSAGNNALAVTGTGSTLTIAGVLADLVISGTAGSGAAAGGNKVVIDDGGVIDTRRTLVGPGGSIWGDGGTLKGNTFVATGGTVSPGHYGPGGIGSLSFTGNLDLSPGGTLEIALGSGAAADFIAVGGVLTLGGTSALAVDGSFADPATAYVIAQYGTLTGIFGSVTGLPTGATLVYNYLGLNQIAVLTAVPEIGTAATGTALALLGGVIGLSERRRRRRTPPAS